MRKVAFLVAFLVAIPGAFPQTTILRGTSPGIWNDSQYQSVIDGRAGTAVNPITARTDITNTAGKRPSAVNGSVNVPTTATTYEADGLSSIVENNSDMTNGVGLSSFSAVTTLPKTGTCNTSGTTVTRVSGPAFNTAWASGVNTLFVINGVDYTIATVPDANTLTLMTSAGSQSGATWAKRIYVWGVNTLTTDWLPGKAGAPAYDWGYLTNEFDFNVGAVNTKVVAMSIGGASQVQPTESLGYLVNTLGSGVKWGCGFCTLDGTASIALQVGVATTGNNQGSQPILLYSRDSGGNVRGAVESTDPDGNLLIRTGFVNNGNANTQTIIQDGAGNNILGVQGAVSGATPVVQGSGVTRFQPGTDTFAHLGSEGGGAQVFCSNCQETDPCMAGGAGALATRVAGRWTCGPTAGAPAFSALSSGSNTTATMQVGTGGSLAPAGSGTVKANRTICTGTDYLIFDGTCGAIPAGSGTVTTVGFTGGLISVATATTTPALTVAGTSGGVPYFSSGSTWASSGALTANLPMIGGGAGAAPAVGSRTGNTTQFATSTGSQTANAFVTIDASGNHVATSPAFTTQTDAATITWALASTPVAHAKVTLAGNRTLNITNPLNGGEYVLNVVQDVSGNHGLILGTGCTWKVSGGGSGAISPSTAGNAIDQLKFNYDGTNCYAIFTKNFN